MSVLDFLPSSKKLVFLIGIWPKTSPSRIYSLRKIFSFINIFWLTIAMIYHASFQIGNLLKLSDGLYMLISVLNSFIKVVLLLINRKEFIMLMEMLKSSTFTRYESVYENVVIDVKKTVRAIEIGYLIEATLAWGFTSLFPVFESKPLPLDFPHFNEGRFHYPFYFIESLALFISAESNTIIDIIIATTIAIAAMQVTILNKKLVDTEKNVKNIRGYSEDKAEKLTLGYLVECCVHYTAIERFVKSIHEVFSLTIFVQLVSSVVAICNSGILILNAEPLTVRALSLVCYFLAMFAQITLYCWFGNIIYLESLEVNTSAYFSDWQNRGTSVRRTLFMLMERTKRPLEIRGLKYLTLSFTTLISILKCSYSFFTLLKKSTMNATK